MALTGFEPIPLPCKGNLISCVCLSARVFVMIKALFNVRLPVPPFPHMVGEEGI